MTPGKDDEDGQMVISVAARAQDRAGFGLIAGRAGVCALALALAGCAQPGALPGAGPGAAPGVAPGTGAAGGGAAAGARPGFL